MGHSFAARIRDQKSDHSSFNGGESVFGPQAYTDRLARRREEIPVFRPQESDALAVPAHEGVHADIAEHPLRRLQLDHAERVVEAPSHGAAAEGLGHGSGDVVAEDGERGGGRSEVPGHPRPQRGVRAPGRTVHLLEGPTLGRADFDAVHDRVTEHLGQVARRTLVRRRDIGWHHPDTADGQLVLPECGIDREDLPTVDAAHGPPLRDVSAHGGQGDVPEQLGVSEGIRQVVPGGPDSRAPRCGLESHEGRPEGTTTEQEIARRRELRRHAHAPMQVVLFGFHPEEGPCVHGAAPYRRW